jgi:hypothetical protein
MPSPRDIAKKKNDASKFEDEPQYDTAAGVPVAAGMPQQSEGKILSHPVNPPEPAKEWAAHK